MKESRSPHRKRKLYCDILTVLFFVVMVYTIFAIISQNRLLDQIRGETKVVVIKSESPEHEHIPTVVTKIDTLEIFKELRVIQPPDTIYIVKPPEEKKSTTKHLLNRKRPRHNSEPVKIPISPFDSITID